MKSAVSWVIENDWDWDCRLWSWRNKETGEIVGVFELMEMYAQDVMTDRAGAVPEIK